MLIDTHTTYDSYVGDGDVYNHFAGLMKFERGKIITYDYKYKDKYRRSIMDLDI